MSLYNNEIEQILYLVAVCDVIPLIFNTESDVKDEVVMLRIREVQVRRWR